MDESQELGGSANDWNQVNQAGNEKQKLDKWLIDSRASVHMMNQKEDLYEPTLTMQAVMIRSGKSMMAEMIRVKPMQLQNRNKNIIKLAKVLIS